MASYLDDEHAEFKKIQTELGLRGFDKSCGKRLTQIDDPDNFDIHERLVRAAEALEGGLNRNSSPQAIVLFREAYDAFLAKFPLLFGYWKKYADLEFSVSGSEAAEVVYERGVASIANSVDLWTNYCAFKLETSHEPWQIRSLLERGASCVGLDFLSHPFWDRYIEFEERQEVNNCVFPLLERLIHMPMHQYARYFERFRHLASTRPLTQLLPGETLAQYRAEVEAEDKTENSEAAMERAVRTKVDAYYLEIFNKTQAETNRRWTYESGIKRPYFHVTSLDDAQLTNWTRYLDFEEAQGDYARTSFLYERCLVTCAHYDDFWLRYARWMQAQVGKEEEVRLIYQRASYLFTPIARPTVRLHYAHFEESLGNVELAKDILEAILMTLHGHIETIDALANLARRHHGLEAAVAVYQAQIQSPDNNSHTSAALLATWAQMIWKVKGSAQEARDIFEQNQQYFLECQPYWLSHLRFELDQPCNGKLEAKQYHRIRSIYTDLREKSLLSPEAIKELSQLYLRYLQAYAAPSAIQEYMLLDREINGPPSLLKSVAGDDKS